MNPQSLSGARVRPGIRENPGDGLVFKNAHVVSTISPPPRSSGGDCSLLQRRPLPKTPAWIHPRRGPGSGGRFWRHGEVLGL